MKNTFGTNLSLTLFGESHGPYVGAVLDGLAPGLAVDEARIAAQLALRRPSGKISTARVEPDPFEIVSGVFHGKTTGTPLTILIPNSRQHSADYENAPRVARPGHADYTANVKYHGYEDYTGGGHFSGRLTAPLVAAGGILLPALEERGICIGTHIARIGSAEDKAFSGTKEEVLRVNGMNFPVLDETAAAAMEAEILAAAEEGDSVGGILETEILGVPAGVGEPWFDTVESMLAHALFGIPAVKGVEFGAGFGGVCGRGSGFNDALRAEGGRITTVTNHNGGVNGGITNGMPIVFRCGVKPTPSISKEQESVDLTSGENAVLSVRGRHDPCIVHRAAVVVTSVAALVICDLLAGRFGTDLAGCGE